MSTDAKQLLELTRRLPVEKVREVVDFAEFLLARSSSRAGRVASNGNKALRRFIGGVKDGALSAGIDDELYGRLVR